MTNQGVNLQHYGQPYWISHSLDNFQVAILMNEAKIY